MRLTTRILNSRVSQRIVLLFISAAILPLLLLAALTLYQVKHQLTAQHTDQVRLSAKMIGMEIFQRLQYTRQQLRLIADNLNTRNTLLLESVEDSNDPTQPSRMTDLFRLSNQGEITPLLGNTGFDGKALLGEIHQQRIPGKAMLLLSAGSDAQRTPNLLLFIPVDKNNPMSDLLGARLLLETLLDTDQLNVRSEQICVISEIGIPIYCNKPYDMSWLADAVSRGNTSYSQQYTWQPKKGEETITAFWSLFLAPHYQLEKWSVVVALPSRIVTATAQEFQKIFLGVGVITMLMVMLLSIFVIRRNMIPLERLLEGTRRLSKGAFSTRVDIQSKDEFSELGEAFNDMAVKLGSSFEQQAALIDLSYKLQHAGIINTALHTVLESLPQFIETCSSAVVYLESSKAVVHVDCLCNNEGKILEHSASYVISQVEIPSAHWQGSIEEAMSYLPMIQLLGFPAGSEITLMPALIKDSVIACLILRHCEPMVPGMEKLFLLTQFCDILASSLSNIRLRQRLEYQAFHDPLTDLPNRTLIKVKTGKALKQARESGQEVALMIMDIDRFKTINDSMGHAAGDELLVQLGDRLKQFVSRRDTLSRFAGDEFVVLFTSDGQPLRDKIPQVLERLDRVFLDPFHIGTRKVRVTASKGIAIYPTDGDSFLDLLKNADAAMYQAKHQKPGSYNFYNRTLQLTLMEELETEQSLIDALNRREFVVHYQPTIHLPSGRAVGAEALIRWNRPGHGLVAPATFIPLAEQTGLIEPIGNWVLKHTCENFLRWRQQGVQLNTVSVNVSSVQLQNPGFVSTVAQILKLNGMPADCLELEITETAFIEDFDNSLAKLQEIRRLGVKVAVDDFGTGYASLKYLKELPADRIKIDRLFIKDLPDSQNDIAIVASLISLTSNLKLGLVAEGIETEAQRDYLQTAGITLAQGFLMSRPLDEEAFVAYLLENTTACGPQEGDPPQLMRNNAGD